MIWSSRAHNIYMWWTPTKRGGKEGERVRGWSLTHPHPVVGFLFPLGGQGRIYFTHDESGLDVISGSSGGNSPRVDEDANKSRR